MKRGEARKARERQPPADLAAVHAQVAALLKDSALQHNAWRTLKRAGREQEANGALRRAAELRTEAHALDTDHAALAWLEEQTGQNGMLKTPEGRDTHKELMAFYQGKGLL